MDVTTRLGEPAKLTPSGFAGLDALLGGGLRPGTVLGLVGAPGTGRTSLALAMAYVAARSHAGAVLFGRALDETEVFARLAARALRRSYPTSEVTYGDIWSGAAFRTDPVRRAINDALGTVVQKVGPHLHVARIAKGEPLQGLAQRVAPLWARHERVLVYIDDLEGFVVPERGALDAQLTALSFELRELAESGVTVVFTALDCHEASVSHGATLLARIVPEPGASGPRVPLELRVSKNRFGPTGAVPLEAWLGALEFTDSELSATGPV